MWGFIRGMLLKKVGCDWYGTSFPQTTEVKRCYGEGAFDIASNRRFLAPGEGIEASS